MLNTDHLELQEQALEPLTRPKFKRLIYEYLNNRNYHEIFEDIQDEGSNAGFD